MATENQKLGEKGEIYVTKNCSCPRCKRTKTLRRLPVNFKCADIICDFCGYLTQVKAVRSKNIDKLPNKILGGAWGVQEDRMKAGIYFPLYIVLIDNKNFSIYYLSADLQNTKLFVPRKPLSKNAKRAGWQGYYYDLATLPEGSIVKLK
jgi:type II restriction enzyme